MGNNYDYDMGVIGGGAAGLTVSSGSAQLGAKTLLVEKERELGGDCLHFGCVPSKTLIKSAHVYHLMKNASEYGLPSVDVPPVDFSKVSDRIRGVIGTIQKHDSEERFCGLGAQVEFGEARFVDEHTIDLNGLDCRALERRQQYTTQRIAKSHAKAAFKRFGHNRRNSFGVTAFFDCELLGLNQVLPVFLNNIRQNSPP